MNRAIVEAYFSSNCGCDGVSLDLCGRISSALGWVCGLSGSC